MYVWFCNVCVFGILYVCLSVCELFLNATLCVCVCFVLCDCVYVLDL